MTLQELYGKIDGNYDQAVQVMRSEKLIDRYIRKLENSHVDEQLKTAADAMDPQLLFESAHALKGVCGNLGLTKMAAAADELTEEFRPGNPRKLSDEAVTEKIQNLLGMFGTTIEGIREYEAEAGL